MTDGGETEFLTGAPISGDEVRGLLTDPGRRISAARFPRTRQDLGSPGLYAWFVDDLGAVELATGLGQPFTAGLIYAGQAGAGMSTATLRSRIAGNHLGGTISGSTFRLTLAAILASRMAFSRNGRALAADGEARVSAWMTSHLEVAVVAVPDRGRLLLLEAELLLGLDPPLNLQGMRPTPVRTAVARLRRALGEVRLPVPIQPSEAGVLSRPPAPATGRHGPDMAAFLASLEGQTIATLSGRPNRILHVRDGIVHVGTDRSPGGQRVDIASVQAAADRLYAEGAVTIDVATVGYRSAFIGAVLAALPGTRISLRPRRVELVDRRAAIAAARLTTGAEEA
jgi:hypothetical protein